MTDEEIERWATTWIEAQKVPKIPTDHPSWWAVEQFMGTGDYEPTAEECWATILAILSRKPDQAAIGMLAAGSLVDVVSNHGAQLIDRIELEARRDPAFRHILGGIWRHGASQEIC
jgi:hypothetical protein